METESPLYHSNYDAKLNVEIDKHLGYVLNAIAKHLGNDNRVADAIKPTPEMFRILVKLVDMQFRGVLDYGHKIPRGLVNVLTSEYQKLTGLSLPKLPD